MAWKSHWAPAHVGELPDGQDGPLTGESLWTHFLRAALCTSYLDYSLLMAPCPVSLTPYHLLSTQLPEGAFSSTGQLLPFLWRLPTALKAPKPHRRQLRPCTILAYLLHLAHASPATPTFLMSPACGRSLLGTSRPLPWLPPPASMWLSSHCFRSMLNCLLDEAFPDLHIKSTSLPPLTLTLSSPLLYFCPKHTACLIVHILYLLILHTLCLIFWNTGSIGMGLALSPSPLHPQCPEQSQHIISPW